ncbi:autotransporter domain-containing protein [Pseudovibrio sp. JE062]|uniref:autotransporter domain-containing protein n=1 Tax=Pseudovibrio sp. JE062 TaxID=439495 RepID=UPI00068061E7|nr:autotransporter domain-containing protein [Pseudovibrio sp. JE062]
MTKVAGTIASHAPFLAAAVVASGPLMLSGASDALGQTWDGSSSADWFTGENWSSNTTPDYSQDVTIDTTLPNLATITDKGTNGTADVQDLVVGDYGQGSLIVSDGGALESYSGSYIGSNNGSTGRVEVTGTGSTWGSSYWIYVGDNGDGTLTVSDGGAVSNAFSKIGRIGGSSGRVEVTGTGSTWTNTDDLVIGVSGDGTLMVSDGGTVSNTHGRIGHYSSSTGSVEVTGTGSAWINSSWLTVGDFGEGALKVSDGGSVSNANSNIGSGSGSTGAVEVTGTGSTWESSGTLDVGGDGDGTLTISEDAIVSVSGVTRLGSNATGSGVLNIGAASGETAVAAGMLDAPSVKFGNGTGVINFNHTDTDYIFSSAIRRNGMVNQLSGTTILTGANTYTGGTTVSGGTLELRGGSASSDSGEISITGGRLQVTNSETVGDTTVDGGALAIATGETLTTGAFTLVDGTVMGGTLLGSSYTVESGNIATALTGTGALTKNGNGTVTLTGTNTYTGDTIISGGTLELRGLSALTDTQELRVGYAGTGALIIAEGSEVNSENMFIGRVSGSVTVTGSAASLDVTTNSIIGLYGTGTLTISDGGRVTSGQASAIGGTDATGAVTVTDEGSVWEAGSLNVGQYGVGSLKIENGGKVTSDSTIIGFDSTSFSGTSSGLVIVTGAGSVWENRDRLVVGDKAPGTLTIADGAIVDADDVFILAYDAISQGTLNIGAAAGETAVKAGTLDTEEVRFGEGTGVINFNHTDTDYTFSADISGTGSVNQLSGTTILTGTNTSDTIVSGGMLVVNGTIGDVTINGGTLGGSGTINGSTTVTSGTIAAGNSPGTLTIVDDLNLTSASVLDFELGSPSGTAGVDSDLIAVGGDLTLDGTLDITDAGGLDAGVYNLITYGGSLTDNGLVVGTAPIGFLYNVQTATVGQVNLLVNPDQLSFWNGAVTSADGTVHGGSGTWSSAGSNWTDATGSASAPYQPDSTLIFQGTPGTVAVDSAGVSVSKGMQFAVDGYSVTGGDVVLNARSQFDNISFRVGDGTNLSTGFTSTIASNLTGTGSLQKTGLGTLVLTGDNTYNGSTTVSKGVLEFRDGATLSEGQFFRVGGSATASLIIADGSDVSARIYTFVATGAGSSGAVTVTGPGTRFQAGSTFGIGYHGNGTLSILEGGLVSGISGNIGSYAGSTGTVEVTGEGSHWKNDFGLDTQGISLAVGRDGTGTLTIAEGGRVTSQKGVIGSGAGSSGDVVVTGDGSLWENSHYMNIGLLGRGTLTISDGGVVEVENSAHLGRMTGSSGTLNIGAAAGDLALAAGVLDAAAVKFGDGDGVINFNHTDTDYTFSLAISGDGIVNQLAGTTILTGANTYTGNTIVSGGELVVNSTIGDVTVNGGVLGGSGTINGSATVTSGTIAAGNSPGTLTVGGDLNLTSASVLDFELGSPSGTAGVDSDLIAVGGDLTLDGSLNITDVGGFDAGVYNLITYGGSLTDNDLEIGLAPTEFNYDIQTATAGQVNLLVNANLLSFWNGAVTSTDGTIHGGSGTWSATGTNWTDADGTGSAPHDPDSFLIFQAEAGAVTVDSAGVSVSKGMQFATDGYSVSGGDIALTGATAIRVGDGTDAGTGYSTVIASDLTGTGSLKKTGLGTLILTGTNTFSGNTTVSGGALVVDGSIGDVRTDGGSLGGSGTLGAVTVNSGAVIAPGNSIGTMNTTSTVFNAGSVYEVELNNGGAAAGVNSDLLAASNTVTINGGTVHVMPENGTDNGSTYTAGTTYTIITAGGGINGTFDSPTPTDDFAFFNFALSYDPNSVFLTSELAVPTFCVSGMSANQCATGDGVFSLDSGTLYNAVLNLADEEAPQALDQLSGEVHASIRTALLEDSRFAREAVLNRMRIATGAVAADGQAQAEKRISESASFWGQGFGGWGSWSGNHNTAGLDRSVGGLFVGGDVLIGDNTRLGAFGGYDNNRLEVNGRRSSVTVDTVYLGAYGGAQFDALGLRVGGSYAWHDIDTARSVAFTGLSENLAGSYDARTAQFFGEVGYRFDHNTSSLEPFANVSYVRLSSDGYSETGGTAALTAGHETMDSTFTTIGLRIGTLADLGEFSAKLSAQAAWQHAFGGKEPFASHAFNGGSNFSVAGAPVARDALVLDVGAAVDLGEDAAIGLSYNGRFGSGLTDQGVRANLTLRF